MFGFLRRKKGAPKAPPEPTHPVADAEVPVELPTEKPVALENAKAFKDDPIDEALLEQMALEATPVEEELLPPAPPAQARPPQPADRSGWMNRLKSGLGRTRTGLSGIFTEATIDDDLYDDLETALLSCDAGIHVSDFLLAQLRETVKANNLRSGEQVREALRDAMTELLLPLEAPLDIDRAEPLVVMMAGVNGAGKTTSIGKLANHLQREGKSILLAAGDTFRAAAREQLQEWGKRNNVQVISQESGDPAAVSFDAVQAGRARGSGVVMIDTAGRLPTQTNLMQELSKIHRVLGKAMAGAPHEVLLVLDGNTGQNMLAQAQAFDDAVNLTGLIVTKLDGTAKGGALAALAYARRDKPIPVYFIGVGEAIEDLQAFSASEFATALLGD
ncbi:MAG: signal recognition particle-docking protein FtsY [Burkholderiaceae bacterium]